MHVDLRVILTNLSAKLRLDFFHQGLSGHFDPCKRLLDRNFPKCSLFLFSHTENGKSAAFGVVFSL